MKTVIIILFLGLLLSIRAIGQTKMIIFRCDTIELRSTETLIQRIGDDLNGEVKYTDHDYINVVKFENGYITRWIIYYKDGRTSNERNYLNGKQHGVYKNWNTYGILVSEGYYFDGFPSGHWIFYYNTGKIESEGEFVSDTSQKQENFILHQKELDEHVGEASTLSSHFDAVPNGLWLFYNKNGVIEKTLKFKSGYLLEMEVGDRFKSEY